MRYIWLFLSVFEVCFFRMDASHNHELYKERFTKIYQDKLWGTNENGEGFSGGGSLIENAFPYYSYLQKFIQEHEIRSVVDLGCGDWTFSRLLDWEGINYIGYDVVESVIASDIKKYGSDHIHFVHGNFLDEEIPEADLMICKHVLQHMPNQDVFAFLELLRKFKHCLILNAAPEGNENTDYPIIDFFPFWSDRGIDITMPPFNVPGVQVLEYLQPCNSSGRDRLIYIYRK